MFVGVDLIIIIIIVVVGVVVVVLLLNHGRQYFNNTQSPQSSSWFINTFPLQVTSTLQVISFVLLVHTTPSALFDSNSRNLSFNSDAVHSTTIPV